MAASHKVKVTLARMKTLHVTRDSATYMSQEYDSYLTDKKQKNYKLCVIFELGGLVWGRYSLESCVWEFCCVCV